MLHTLLRDGRRTATVTLGKNQGDDTVTSVRSIPQDSPLPIPLPPHHSTYYEPMATMVAERHAVADTTYLPKYTDPLQVAQAMHGLHMSEMLWYDVDGVKIGKVTYITG